MPVTADKVRCICGNIALAAAVFGAAEAERACGGQVRAEEAGGFLRSLCVRRALVAPFCARVAKSAATSG